MENWEKLYNLTENLMENLKKILSFAGTFVEKFEKIFDQPLSWTIWLKFEKKFYCSLENSRICNFMHHWENIWSFVVKFEGKYEENIRLFVWIFNGKFEKIFDH